MPAQFQEIASIFPSCSRLDVLVSATCWRSSLRFWTYAISDINAVSQVSAISVLLLTLYAWIDLERRRPDALLGRERLLLGTGLAFIFILYPESLPLLLVVSFAAYYGRNADAALPRL